MPVAPYCSTSTRLPGTTNCCDALRIPRAMLPQVVPSSHVIAESEGEWFGGSIPVAGCAGDQQAASFGQLCFAPGTAKNTYGTGCFLLFNTGHSPKSSQHQLLTTVGWQIGSQVTYFLEGAVFVAGALVQWLRDGLGLIRHVAEIESLAASVTDSGGVVVVPAFAGLGAPYWDPDARGTILGITRGTTKGHIARAAMESIAWQTRDLVESAAGRCRPTLDGLACRRRSSDERPSPAIPGGLLGDRRAAAANPRNDGLGSCLSGWSCRGRVVEIQPNSQTIGNWTANSSRG